MTYGDKVDIADEEEEGLMSGGGGGRGEGKGLPPKWVDLSDEVEEVLGRVKGKSELSGSYDSALNLVRGRARGGAEQVVSTLDKLHAKHVLPGFTDRTAEEREIERQTADITRVSGSISKYQ